ncbi:MAG: hypothetical protein JWM14_3345 [Chitinophagaceae bacterium]|nr:hypothetical protein [Chitinophagaceae bacterium]
MKQLFSFEKKDLVFLFLLLLFIGDTVYSYYQHSLAPIDGDIPSLVAPSDAYQQVLHDPFGFKILQTGENTAASNRFFVQWPTYAYFRYVPLWLQSFLSPIDSVYASIALAKTFIQVGLILLLVSYICITFGWKRNEGILAAVVICPLFQAVGFFEYLCVIDNCISYAIAYAFSTLILMVFLFPYYRAAITGHSGLPSWLKPLWLLLPIGLTFSGPVTGPVLLILCPSTLLYFFYQHWKIKSDLSLSQRFSQSINSINRQLFISFVFTTLLCIYSFYIGTHNSENSWEVISLTERYKKLLEGLIKITSFSEGFMPIVLVIFYNLFILQRYKNTDIDKLVHILYFALLFAAAYILLLPMGGYRPYRPYIIRRDTLQPVLWLLFFAWGLSTVSVLKYTHSTKRVVYASIITLICLGYTLVDKLPDYTNVCERQAMQEIAAANGDCIELKESCMVMQWGPASQCEDTRYAATLLHLWNITPREIKYHQKVNP